MYDANGEAFDPSDNGGLIRAVAAAVACILLIAVLCHVVQDGGGQPADATPTPTYQLTLDCGNAALMHSYGMPTKADVMEWHMTGQWGYRAGGRYFVYADLPGEQAVWDGLYQIEQNPAFDK